MALLISRKKIANSYGVLILDQSTACVYKAPEHSTLIRIKGKNETGIDTFYPLVHPGSYGNIQMFEFDDVDFTRVESHSTVFDAEMAVQIVDAFEQYRETKKKHPDALLVVHCQAGISRSSAVACGYAQFEQNADMENAIRTSGFSPNARVFRCLFEEIQRRERFVRVKDLREMITDLPEETILNMVFETSHMQHEQPVTSLAVSRDGNGNSRLIVAHEIAFLNMKETKFRDYFDKEQSGFSVLKDSQVHHGIDAPDILKRYLEKIRKDWSERYQMPMPMDCPSCDHTLLPEQAERYEPGFSFYRWRCTKAKCDQNKGKELITKAERLHQQL